MSSPISTSGTAAANRRRRFTDASSSENSRQRAGDRGRRRSAPPVRRSRRSASPADGLAEALFDLASVLNQPETIDLALLYDRFALALRPQFPLAQLLLADVLSAQNKPEESLAVLRRDPDELALLLVGAAARRGQSRHARPHRRGDRAAQGDGGGEPELGRRRRAARRYPARQEALRRGGRRL